MIKFLGCAFIVLTCSGIGFIMASEFGRRVREIKQLKVSLQMLETEISYSNTPLPEAFESVSSRSSSPVKDLFLEMSSNLKKRIYSTVGEAFDYSVDSLKDRTSLAKDDIEILKSFGQSIGNSDTEGQIKSFALILKQLEGQEAKAEETKAKNEKMYKSLGVLAGFAIAILLV